MQMTWLLLQQIVMMMIMILAGVVCRKIGLIAQKAYKDLSNLLLLVVNPLLILSIFQQEYNAAHLRGLFIAMALSLAGMAVMIVLSSLLLPAKNNPLYRIERFCASYPNCGFFGIPLVNGIFGAEGVFYLTGTIMVFNVLLWTHGVRQVGEGGLPMSVKQIARRVLNPMILCCIVGILSYVLRLAYPAPVIDAMRLIGQMNTPLAMLIIGGMLAGTNFKKVLCNRRIYYIALLKLVVLPLGLLALFAMFTLPETIWVSVMIALAGPTATGCVSLAILYDNEPVYASEIIAITTIATLFTLPAVILLGRTIQAFLH